MSFNNKTTTQKHRNFVAEPMGDKPVTALPGIGNAIGGRLSEAGYHKANSVLGQYLVSGGSATNFNNFLKKTANANTKQSDDCRRALEQWSNEFL